MIEGVDASMVQFSFKECLNAFPQREQSKWGSGWGHKLGNSGESKAGAEIRYYLQTTRNAYNFAHWRREFKRIQIGKTET
jgi:hypothetical protein